MPFYTKYLTTKCKYFEFNLWFSDIGTKVSLILTTLEKANIFSHEQLEGENIIRVFGYIIMISTYQ